jgi:hypothetical protein
VPKDLIKPELSRSAAIVKVKLSFSEAIAEPELLIILLAKIIKLEFARIWFELLIDEFAVIVRFLKAEISELFIS